MSASRPHKTGIAAAPLPEFFNSLSSADEFLKIEKEERQHHPQIIVDLKARRNSYLPIYKLPVEILLKIFQATQDAYIDPMTHKFFPDEDLAWIAITYVCRHWRNAALNDSSLWTRPPLRYSEWTAVMLERSRMAGLRMFFDDRFPFRKHAHSALVAHIWRTIELTIKWAGDRPELDKLFKGLRTAAAPMLRRLEIEGTLYSNFPPRLPANTLLGATKLRHLSLTAVDLNWRSHLLSSLTTLSIRRGPNGAGPTPAEFLDILERMPDLKSLCLHQGLPTHDNLVDFTNTKRERVSLPVLESLSIHSDATECEFFWNNITTTINLNDIDVSVTYQIGSNIQMFRFLTAIYNADSSECFETNSRSFFITGTVTDRTAYNLRLRASEHLCSSLGKDSSLIHHGESNGLGFALNIEAHNFPDSLLYGDQGGHLIFREFFDSMRWNRLYELNLIGLELFTNDAGGFSQTLARTFGTLRELRTVMVGIGSARQLVDALLMDSDEDPTVPPDCIVFPGLRHIKFDHVVFQPRFGQYDKDAVTVERLQNCLISRFERGVQIYSVLIEMCSLFDEEDLETLQEIVVDVHWDGVKRTQFEFVSQPEDENNYWYNEGDFV